MLVVKLFGWFVVLVVLAAGALVLGAMLNGLAGG